MINEYFVGLSVKGLLKGENRTSFCFILRKKKIQLEVNKDGAKHFKGFVTIDAQNYWEAIQNSSEALCELLDSISFVTGGSFSVMYPFLILKNEIGKLQRIAFRQSFDEHEEPTLLREQSGVDSIQIILDEMSKQNEYDLSMRWIRYGNGAQALIDRFIFYWLSFERLVGEVKIEKKCPSCGKTLEPHWAMNRVKALNLFNNHTHKKTDFNYFKNAILKMRNKVFHGSKMSGNTFKELNEIYHKIKEVSENELKRKYFDQNSAICRQSHSDPWYVTIASAYSFTTNNPAIPFALDYPSDAYIESERGGIQAEVDGINLIDLHTLIKKNW